MKKSPAFALSIVFAIIALFFGTPPDALAAGNTIRTVYTTSGPAQDCSASLLNQYSPSATNLCWSGTNSSNYRAFSLQALQAGVETFPLATNTTPTLELYNDTSSTTVSLKLVGNIGSNQPISCQGITGSTGCEISGPSGTFNSQTSPDSTATYPAASSSGSWPAVVTITFFGVPMNSYVGLQWASWTGVDQTGISFGGQVANYASAVSSCGVTPAATTVKGVVYAPNGVDPLPNALVSIPRSAPGALTSGTQCIQASAVPLGGVITSTVSAADGTFTLTGVPSGANIPIVIQVGKWRMQRTIATVAACGNTPLAALSTTLPSNQFAGDIPKIALVTGSEDAIQCVLRKTGVLDSEFTNSNGTGRINLFLGGGNPGSSIDPATPGQEVLVGNPAMLGNYDMVMLPSQGALYPLTSADLANIYEWANIGGRLFASHDSVTWLANNPLSGVGFGAAAQWDSWQANASADSASATVNSGFPAGSVLSTWLGSLIVNPSNGPVTLPTAYVDQLGPIAPTQSWLSLDAGLTPTGPAHPSMQFTFNTPVGAAAENQCGRVLYTEYPTVKTNANGSTFPAECSASPMTPEEHLVEYSLFDLSNAITPVVAASVSQTFTNSPSSFKQGDSADQVTIAITNTSSAVALGSTLVVNGALPSGVTVNTSSFVSGGWSCSSKSSGSAFTCTRSSSLAASATDLISIPVAVEATYPVGASASLTDIVSGGGLPSPVAGSDSISITGLYSPSNCSASPCTPANGNSPAANPLGIANAYNLIALNGNISDTADITGRIAASGQVTLATTIGTALRDGDPYVALASGNGGPWAIVAAAGIPTSDSFNINAGGNVYSFTPTSAGFNFANENYSGSIYSGSTLVTDGTSPIDFSSLSAWISSLSSQLSASVANGMVCSVDSTGTIIPDNGCPTNPIYFNSNSQHYNPSWLVLYGTDATTNVFNLTQAQFETSNVNLDIEVPTGSTTVINVTGADVTLHTDLYFQGNTVINANAGTILYNFPAANSLTINGQLDGTVLAPHAALSGFSQMGGVFLAASIGSTGEAHYIPFTGTLPNSGSTPSTLTVTGPAVTTGEVGAPFNSGPLTVTGGTSPDTFTVVGTLPVGLTLNPSTGAITGTPTTAGTFSVKVTDAAGATGTSSPITINPAFAVTGPAVTIGEVGSAFNSGPLTITGGVGPDTFSVVGTLPAGLTLNLSTGAITGTATTAGTFSVKVTDAAGATGTSSPITINPAFAVTGPAVTTGEVGVAFNSGPLIVTGGVGPDTFSIVGTPPAGLMLNPSTGAITGTATTAGTFSVKVTDAAGATGTSSPITINTAFAVTGPAVTTGEVGVAFNSGPLIVTGGVGPDTFSIVGTPPAGLMLNPSTGAITGTATTAGTFSVKVTDAAGATGTSSPITINTAFAVTGPAVTTGEVGVAFNSGPLIVTGGVGPDTFSIVGTPPAGLMLNPSTGAITGAITGTAATAGTFSVKVTDAAGATGTSSPITINTALAVSGPAVTTGEVGAPFSSGPIIVIGGVGPDTFKIVGTVPAGLTLNPATGGITGTATSEGTFSVKVTDAAGAVGTSSPITITPAASLSVTKSADSASIAAGGIAGYKVILSNVGSTTASGLTLSDPLPAGIGNDIQWTIDPTTGNPSSFSITGSTPNQQLVMNGTMSVLAATTITNTGPTIITGDIGLSPGTSITGFLPGVVTGATHDTDAAAATAKLNLIAAYVAAAGKSGGITLGGELAGRTLTAGVYMSASSLLNSGDLILDAQGNPNATFTFQMGSTLTTMSGSHIILANGANACNVFWQVGSSATLGTYSVFKGNIFALTSITVTTGVNLEGTALARNGAVTLDSDVISGCGQSLAAGASLAVHITGTTTGNDLNSSTNTGILNNTATVCAANAPCTQSTAAITLNPALAVTGPGVTTGEVGAAFNSGPLTVSGGTGPDTFSIVGILPAGLTLNPSTGAVTGTPTNAGTFSVKVTDAAGASVTGSSITINPALSVTGPAVTSGQVGAAFNSGATTVSGGTGSYAFSITGTLPAGLTLNPSTGVVIGTPTTAGTFSIKVTDAGGVSGTSSTVTIGVSPTPSLSITKSADSASITAGGVVGYRVIISNVGAMTASGLTLSDLLPAGAGGDIQWAIDSTTGNPSAFNITGSIPNQQLVMNGTMSVLAASTITNTGPTVVTGDIGLSPGTSVTGFPPGVVTGSIHAADLAAATAQTNLTNAYLTAAGKSGGITVAGDLAGQTLTAGVYTSASSLANSGDLILDAQGNPNATFTFQMGSTLTTITGSHIILANGANACNVFWQVGSSATLGTYSVFKGNILALTSVTVTTGVNLEGTALARNGAVTLDSDVISGCGQSLASGASLAVHITGTTTGNDLNPSTNTGVLTNTAKICATNAACVQSTAAISINSTTVMSITCPAVTSGQLGAAFNSGALSVSGGTAPYTFAIVGTLPAGLTLDTSTGAITGIPTVAGSFSIKVTDSRGATASTCTFNIGAGYSLTVNPSSVTVVAGQTAITTFTFSPYGGYTGTVSFACAGLPLGATCTFSPSSLTANGSNTVQTSMLSITTTANGIATIARNEVSSSPTLASILVLPGLLLGGLLGWRRRSLKRGLKGMLLITLLSVTFLGGVIGCGTNIMYSTPAGTKQVTVTAQTSATTTAPNGSTGNQTATFTLIVTR